MSARFPSRKEIEKACLSWMNKEAPAGAYLMTEEHPYVIVDVFTMEKVGADLIGEGEKALSEQFFFPLGKVLQVGSMFEWDKGERGAPFEVGEYVRLKDDDVRTIINPQYQAWVNNEYSQSEMKQIGRTPDRLYQNFIQKLGHRALIPDVFELDTQKWKDTVVYLDRPNLLGPIGDAEAIKSELFKHY